MSNIWIAFVSQKEIDFVIEDNGSIILLRPITEAAKEWIEEHLPEDRMYFGNAVVVEPRYIADIASGIEADGLTWRP